MTFLFLTVPHLPETKNTSTAKKRLLIRAVSPLCVRMFQKAPRKLPWGGRQGAMVHFCI